jgi:hypothetical protein
MNIIFDNRNIKEKWTIEKCRDLINNYNNINDFKKK